MTFLLGFAPLGSRPVLLATLFVAMTATAILARRRSSAVAAPASLLMVALIAEGTMEPLAREFMTPLDEGMVMDMPITVPRASVTENVDDLKTRDMILCRFPEVDMVVGKGGRGETPTDPAPMDMIETMVNFRPRELWPRRKLRAADALAQGRAVHDALVARGIIRAPETAAARQALVGQAVQAALPLFDAASREYAYHRNQEMLRSTGWISPTSSSPTDPEEARVVPLWRGHVEKLDGELMARAAPIYTRLVLEQLLDRATIIRPAVSGFSRSFPCHSRGRCCGRDPAHSTAGRRPRSWHNRAGRPRALDRASAKRSTPSRTSWPASSAAASCSGRSGATSSRGWAASWIPRSRCPAGRMSGRCRSRTGSTCSRRVSTHRSASG